jgi:hypothetical protein
LTAPTAALQVNSIATGTPVLIARGAASQTANLFQAQNSAGTVLFSITSGGAFGNQITANAGIDVVGGSNALRSIAGAATVVPIVAKGAASQTANLQEWQNSAGSALAIVSSAGVMIAPTLQTTSALTQISEENSGGRLRLTKMTASAGTTSTDLLKLYVVAGTLPGTLKLAVRAGTGAETTILDNIPQ